MLLGGGWPNSLLRGPHASQLAKAVSRVVAPSSGSLGLIVVTHGRGAGALPALLRAHPGALVRPWGQPCSSADGRASAAT